MGKLVEMDRSGHKELEWTPENRQSVADATAKFDKLVKGEKYVAYRVENDGSKALIQNFDKDAPQIIVHPQMIGG